MNIFNLLPIMLYKTAVLGVGAAGIFLPVLCCTRERPMNNLEKGAFLIIGTIVLTIIYYQNGFF